MPRTASAVELKNTFDDITNARTSAIRQKNVRVPLEEIATYHARHGGWVDKVIFVDENGVESWAWGKSWVSNSTGKITRVGAGAYGDMTVWESNRGP